MAAFRERPGAWQVVLWKRGYQEGPLAGVWPRLAFSVSCPVQRCSIHGKINKREPSHWGGQDTCIAMTFIQTREDSGTFTDRGAKSWGPEQASHCRAFPLHWHLCFSLHVGLVLSCMWTLFSVGKHECQQPQVSSCGPK